MTSNRRKLFLQEYIGLCNRLESLTLAYAIQQAHGHEVLLDWAELDSLVVRGAIRGAPGFWGRLGALRLRESSRESFDELRQFRKILLRTFLGPSEKLDPLYRETIGRIPIRPAIASEIRAIFKPLQVRPVIGVHIRRGDYPMENPDEYDTNSTRHPAVPLWWYERTMAALQKYHREAAFYLSSSGSGTECDDLRRNFDVVQARSRSPYRRNGSGHHAEMHPVVDLFALACCSVLLPTPLSSFSFIAGNLLGPQATNILPPLRVSRNDWAAVQMDGADGRLVDWTEACRSGGRHCPLWPDLKGVAARPANTDWLPVLE